MDYRLGQPVEVTAWIFRDTKEMPNQEQKKVSKSGVYFSNNVWRRVWSRTEFYVPKKGFIVGKRTLAEGDLSSSGYRQRLKNCKYIQVYLVVTNIHEKPLRVLPNDITALDL